MDANLKKLIYEVDTMIKQSKDALVGNSISLKIKNEINTYRELTSNIEIEKQKIDLVISQKQAEITRLTDKKMPLIKKQSEITKKIEDLNKKLENSSSTE